MRVIIAGSRSIIPETNNVARRNRYIARARETVFKICDGARKLAVTDFSEVVSGTCRGVDKLGETWAKLEGIKVTPFPADWKKYGSSAGPKRNEKMALYADALILIWDGKSKGSGHMKDLAEKHGLAIFEHIFKWEEEN